MKAFDRNAFKFVLAASLLVSAAIVTGQGIDSPDPETLGKQITAVRQLIDEWKSRAEWEFGLAMTVVVLGATVAVLQSFGARKWCSYSVAVAGIAISALTFITKEFFEADHKTYRKVAIEAEREIRTAEMYLQNITRQDVALEDKIKQADQIGERIRRVYVLQDKLLGIASATGGASEKAARAMGLIATAYAQGSAKPSWISQQRIETTTAFRFVGSGTATSVAAAEAQSLLNAQHNAATGLSVPLESVQRFARTIDTYIEYDAAQKIYRYNTLIEVNRALVRR